MKLPPLAIQTCVFGKSFNQVEEADFDQVLAAVKNAGFDAVEASFPDAGVLQRLLTRHGLKQAARHMTISHFTDPEPVFREFAVTGARDVCNSGLLKWGELTTEDYHRSIEVLNDLGRKLRAEGIHLHYHNHDFEFSPVAGGKTGIDLLLEGLDFSIIDLCVDVAWVWRGGLDPAAFLREHAERIGYLHLKDTTETDWTELGRGLLDWKTILETVENMPHVRWATVEQDSTKIDPAQSCQISRAFLRENFDY